MKIKEKEQIFKMLNETHWNGRADFRRLLKAKLTSLPTDDSPTIKEVKEYCDKQYEKEIPDTCYKCDYGMVDDGGYVTCSFEEHPHGWDIELTQKVISDNK